MDPDDIVATFVDARDEKRALRGLPLLFVVWLGFIGPIFSLVLNGFFTMRWGTMYPAAVSYYASWHFWWFIAARELSRMLAAATMFVRRSADAVWFAILVLWLSGPTLVTVTWLLFGNIVMPAALVRSTAIAAAATLYLTRSGRVRAIYPLKPSKLSSSRPQFAEG
jgi:hypothetical protein